MGAENEICINKPDTIKFYQNYNDVCHCLYCEHYYSFIEKEYPYLKQYLSQLNIDILKPIEAIEYPLDENESQYEAFYALCGTLSKEYKEKVRDLTIEFIKKDVLYQINNIDKYFLVRVSEIRLRKPIESK